MDRSQELIRKVMESNVKIAELVQKNILDDDEKCEKLDGLRQSMATYCEVDNNIKKYELCESELVRRRTPAEIENNKDFKEFLQVLNKKKQDVTKHEMYCKLERTIRRFETQKEVDTDMEIQYSTPNLTCPISRSIMTSPMKNWQCGHVYDRSSVLELLKISHKKCIPCPVPGCVKTLKLSDLQPNEVSKKIRK